MSIILDSGSNRFTKWAMKKLYKWKYDDICFTHALLHIQNGDCLNVGFSNYIQDIDKILKPSHRYFAIFFKDLTSKQKKDGIRISYKKAGSKEKKFKFYDFKGYLWQSFSGTWFL